MVEVLQCYILTLERVGAGCLKYKGCTAVPVPFVSAPLTTRDIDLGAGMACSRMIALLAVVALFASVHAQTGTSTQTQVINRLVPVTARVVNNATGAIGVTPASSVVSGRKLLQTPQPAGVPVYNKPATYSTEFVNTIVPITQKKNTMAFLGQIKQAPGSDLGDYTFIFGEEAQPWLKSLAVSGTTFKFVGASAILPQDQTATTAPNSVFSASGFVSADGSATTAIVSTKTPVGVVPNVALKFDYTQTVGSPAVSVYYTDRKASFATGGYATNSSNLAQAFGVYIAPGGTVYPGQG
ncbi:hypothetical protein COCOBI_13-1920 [Coccomyxa sp. Obi]|nr:hypothetical protein COCOBI_13-1920 [Coccomyxa sp. Obi]